MSSSAEPTAMDVSNSAPAPMGEPNGAAAVVKTESNAVMIELSAAVEDVKMAREEDEKHDAEIESESSEEESDNSEEEEGNAGPPMPTPPAPVPLTDANGRPLSDFEVAARYAAIEIQSMASQLASTVVDTSKPVPAPVLASSISAAGDAMEDDDDDDEEDEVVGDVPAESSDEDSSDEEGLGDEDDPRKLRAEIEAAMEKEENKVTGPLKTVNEVAAVPVREPEVKELTADCPIARCGVVLNVSRPGLIVTIKSDHGVKPLDEGSVLCFEDRTVLGCVDEVFGPVLMPMYLVRFENAEKIPAQTDLNKHVYFATEHTTYIIPENIRDKGTDASNIFDEETDETVYSDDEAEAAAKRQNRKRNRGENAGAPGAPASNQSTGSGQSGNFTDYQAGESQYGGRGRGGRGGRGGRSGRGGRGQNHSNPSYHQQHQPHHQQHQHHVPPAHVQAQPQGGFTRYTTPGYGQPGMQGYPPAPPQPYGGAPQYQQNQYSHMQAPPMPMYQQQQYGAPQHLPPYPPQAPPPPNYYAQPQTHGYPQPPPPPPPPPGHYGAPPAGYYQQQPDPNAYGHQGHHHPPPPPPPPPSGPPGGRRY